MPIKKGDTVFVHYTGTLDDGTEFDSSKGRDPLEFIMGGGMIIPGFEAAVLGKNVGDNISVRIPPAEAYGERNNEMLLIVPRGEVPGHIEPKEGLWLQIAVNEGELDVVVSRVSDDEVELDGNHPLAGKHLNFAIEIVTAKSA